MPMFSPEQAHDRAEIDLAELLWIQLRRISQRMWKAGSQMTKPFGITPPQYALLRSLAAGGEMTQQMVADESLISKSEVSQTVTILERDGLLVRVPDGNRNQLVLTPKAEAILSELIPLHEQLSLSAMSSLSPDEREQLSAMLSSVEEALCKR